MLKDLFIFRMLKGIFLLFYSLSYWIDPNLTLAIQENKVFAGEYLLFQFLFHFYH